MSNSRYEPDNERPTWRTPQSVFYKGRKPSTRLRCFEQMSEKQAERRRRIAELESQVAQQESRLARLETRLADGERQLNS